MRIEKARTIALLEAKGVEKYEIVLLALHPERWEEMASVSRSKRLPLVHVANLFFGLDFPIIMEAFGNATTSMSLNSSRFGKVTTLQVAFGFHPLEFQICGCHVSSFLLEKSRVTSERGREAGDQNELNFRVLYAMELHFDGVKCFAFTYLGRSDHKLAEQMSKEETWKKDTSRKAIFNVLSAVLWLGNIELDYPETSGKLLIWDQWRN
ncbi:uncharacterized protein PITG_21004 [Phytophthora infestans T30-4]|uniref:Myosin motor domain-containing protein n=1 Tax=Phytophthora infestans (strain T30-4) TaxID=403677 RepID=D0P2R9_PHYIT|nr:uncharacterized protein PITG_21004 [Phytophthora infestans T30-4]EEY56735.1 conserved hypothetical protein [Phytophthora infestans T30-4]|eukprot:XP_002895407.1 conserved hypothetical protein [Phytophthora infestans T30-4]